MRKNSLIFVICLAVALAMAAVPVLAKMAPAGVQVMGQKNNTSTLQGQIKNQNGQTNAEEHRSAVANFVQTLLKTASTTEGTVGEQVRIIAREQNRAMATTTEMMEKIQNRNKIKTFLFGSDYKNLGALRSEMVQTRNRIEQLNRIMGKKASTTEVQTQIQNLEQEQTRMENFIKAQEGKFSLFGWLTKWFNK
ncbi:hypothetical protein GYA54_00360 [Candidatus Kuenenbacteria bacterium]|nr:hypothetical protein [Candidatus Kuenenbacteria bacterium]